MPDDQHDAPNRRFRATLTSNPLALALGILAVVIAGTGSAVAVTLAKTTIVDPKVKSRAVRVDSSGHLAVAGKVSVAGKVALAGPVSVTPPTATVSVTTNVSTPLSGYTTVLIRPTTATVAVTGFSVGNPSGNKDATNATYYVALVQDTVDAAGNCSPNDRRYLVRYDVGPGDYHDGDFSTPLLVRPIAGKKYCLSAYGITSNGNSDTGPYFSYANFGAYAVSGTVTTQGLAGRAANQQRKTLR